MQYTYTELSAKHGLDSFNLHSVPYISILFKFCFIFPDKISIRHVYSIYQI